MPSLWSWSSRSFCSQWQKFHWPQEIPDALIGSYWLYYKSLFRGIIPCASCPVSDPYVLFISHFLAFTSVHWILNPFPCISFFCLAQLLIHFPGVLLRKHSVSIVSMIFSKFLLCSAMARVCQLSHRLRMLCYVACWLNGVSDLAENLKDTYDT